MENRIKLYKAEKKRFTVLVLSFPLPNGTTYLRRDLCAF